MVLKAFLTYEISPQAAEYVLSGVAMPDALKMFLLSAYLRGIEVGKKRMAMENLLKGMENGD
jgi:hypothetical protein